MRKKILNIVGILFGLVFINAGLNKFFNYMPVPEDLPLETVEMMESIMQLSWLLPLVGLVEILGGVLFMIPKFRALGSIIILPVMIGILLTHLINIPSGLPIAIILFAINIWAILENHHKYAPMLR